MKFYQICMVPAIILTLINLKQKMPEISIMEKAETTCKPNSDIRILNISNGNGMKADICNYGARITSLKVPSRNGELVDVVMGFANAEEYTRSSEPYYGATIGRYANRLSRGRFSLDGKEYQISINNGQNALHGGKNGFHTKIWDMEYESDSSVVCRLHSPNGDEGFPGAIDVEVTYKVTKMNQLVISYRAVSDATTVINLTNHAFFNLNGSGSILGHTLRIVADSYTPVDHALIPTGKIALVKGTPFDFREGREIGAMIDNDDIQLRNGKGYDHNFVLSASRILPAAMVTGDKSGITMRVYTAEPGLQFYSGNFMDGSNILRTGPDEYRTAFCLETQHYPDSPNHKGFPETVLRKGDEFTSRTIYAFSAH